MLVIFGVFMIMFMNKFFWFGDWKWSFVIIFNGVLVGMVRYCYIYCINMM